MIGWKGRIFIKYSGFEECDMNKCEQPDWYPVLSMTSR